MSGGELLWRPSIERVQGSNMYSFMLRMSRKYGFPANWQMMHRWSNLHRDEFWRAMWELAEIRATKPAEAVCVGEGIRETQWFPGLEFNFAEHLLRFDEDRPAILAADELGRQREISFRSLREQVARCAAGLKEAGVVRGDRVGGFLPNIPEAVMAMLATASLGAIWSSCSPDFGIQGVFDRFGQIEPKVLIAADGYTYNGKPNDSLERIKGIVERIPSIRKVAVVPFLRDKPEIADIPNSVLWSQFLHRFEPLTFESVPFDHPLYIMYSSGTTGVPKCIVHGAGGTVLQHMKELMLHTDLKAEDRIFFFTTCGWMMWNWLVSSLGVGAAVVLYEGSPFHPDPHHLWRMTEKLGITVFGTSPKYVMACQSAGLNPGKEHDLSKLRAVLSTGSPLTVEGFRWIYQNVKSDLQLSSICGGTDIISCFMLGNPMLPVYAGEIQCLGLGMDVRAYGLDGKPVTGSRVS